MPGVSTGIRELDEQKGAGSFKPGQYELQADDFASGQKIREISRKGDRGIRTFPLVKYKVSYVLSCMFRHSG